MDAVHIDTRLNQFPAQDFLDLETIAFLDDSASSCKASLREWLIPLKCNIWVQAAAVLMLVGITSTALYLMLGTNVLLGTAFYTIFVSLVLLIATFAGKDTLRSYRRVRNHIKSHGSFNKRLQRKYLEQMYCRRAGARKAAQDLGVAHELLPALANSWRLL